MALRREQGLLIGVVLLGALIWFNREGAPTKILVRPQVEEYTPAPPPATALVTGGATEAPARVDLFREPSESTPLPPRPLPEPPGAALPVVWLPLVPGQHAQAYHQLRGPGEVVQVALEAEPGAGGPAAGATEPAATTNGGGQRVASGTAEWERTWDRIELAKGGTFWGEILNDNKARLIRGILTVPVKIRWVSPETGKVNREQEFAPADIKAVHLAKTLRNEVAQRELEISDEVSNLPVRAELIEWLLQQATREGWAYDKALELAHGYAKIAPNEVEGLRMVTRVLRAAGRLGDEWRLYQNLPAALADSSFRWAGQGRIEALLGLHALAEEHLRRATAGGNDPWAAVAFTEFLLARGRTDEAVAAAREAYAGRAQVRQADDQAALRRAVVSAYLAAGLLEEAREALPANGTALRGAVAYAAGDTEFAAGQFRAAAEHDEMTGLAALGSAACTARAGSWPEAKVAFESVADRDPFLRARALGGVGLVLERTGNFEQAAAALEKAIATDPTDPWLAYLRGRSLRLAGDLDGAAEQLTQALRLRDDLVEAMAEMAETDLRIAERDEGRAAESLVHAVRYADRCVELDEKLSGKATPRFLELQGLVHWRAGNLRIARRAFEAAQQAGSTYGQVGVALIDYAQGRVEEARARLSDLDKRPLGDPFREFGRATLALIDDHAEKVEIRDDFEREELGGRWTAVGSARNTLRPTLERGRLRVRGRPGDPQKTGARRVVEAAGDFVAAEVVLETARTDVDFVGLQLQVGRDERSPELMVQLGFASLLEGVVPALRLWDGSPDRAATPEDKAKFEWRPLEGVSATGPHRLLLEFLPDGEGFLLRATWNDRVVAEEKLTRVRRGLRTPMHVDLVVEAKNEVDVAFDRFRLRQRQRR